VASAAGPPPLSRSLQLSATTAYRQEIALAVFTHPATTRTAAAPELTSANAGGGRTVPDPSAARPATPWGVQLTRHAAHSYS
jgi:hypothetical protein